jgi:uncharacterized repeat protein (TIGR02543 family)
MVLKYFLKRGFLMKTYRILFVTLAILLIGVAFLPLTTPVLGSAFKWQNYAGNYQSCYALNVNISSVNRGTVDALPAPNCPTNALQYATNTAVKLTAKAKSGFVFANWSGSAAGTSSSLVVVMNANKTITATFNPGVYVPLVRKGLPVLRQYLPALMR